VDDGAAWEIGYYFALKRGKVIGIRTDFRRAGESQGAKVNSMIECSCERVVGSVDELFQILEFEFEKEIAEKPVIRDTYIVLSIRKVFPDGYPWPLAYVLTRQLMIS
jgi:nucleoside 2-deoxyribosyltransferase